MLSDAAPTATPVPQEDEGSRDPDALETPASISLTQSAITLAIGDALNLHTLIRGSEGVSYTFASSNPDALAVNAAGIITARAAGDATITITNANDSALSCTLSVAVSAAEESVSIAISPDALGARMTGTITISHESAAYGLYELEYDASIIDVRRLDADTYSCTAKSVDTPRTLTVRAVSTSGRILGSADLRIAPAPNPGEIDFENRRVVLALGDTHTRLAAKCASGTICELRYASSNPDIVSIDPSTGAISANAVTPDGEYITITACDQNNPAVRANCAVFVCAAPESIAFTQPSLRMAEGERVDLMDYLRAQPDGAVIGRDISFAADSDCVSIDANGILTAAASGSATITAVYGDMTCTLSVRVLRSGTPTISPAAIQMGGGSAASFTLSWPQDCTRLYHLECDTALIDIDSIAEGEGADTICISAHAVDAEIRARIRILDANEIEIGALPVEILPAPLPGEVYFSPEDQFIQIGLNETNRFARAHCAVGTMCDFIYESSDPALVAVDRTTGLLTPAALTENGVCAVITATAKNNPDAMATCRVIVTNAPERVYFAQDSVQIGVGEAYDLRDAGLTLEPESAEAVFTYASSRTDIAQVSKDGMITGIAQGTAIITATAHNGKSAMLTLTVSAKSGSAAFEKADFRIGSGMRAALKVVHSGGYGGSYRAVSSHDALRILSIRRSPSGTDTIIITARNVNVLTSAQIILYNAEDTEIARCAVSILPAPASISCDPDQISMRIGAQMQLSPVNPHENTLCDFSYFSSDSSIAQVSRDGAVTAIRPGTAIISIRATGSGAMTHCTITVLPMPEQIIGAKNEICLGTRQKVAFTTVPAAADCEYTYSITNTSIATVDTNGLITGLVCGTTQITVKTQTGVTATFDITVVPYNTQHDTITTAHRGASGYRTENTLDAFRYANELGADEIELDVYRTADGVLIVHHDDVITYNRKSYHPSQLTYAQVLSVKSYVCTLDQALSYIATTNMSVLVEFKMNYIESDVIDCVERNNVQNKTGYICFDNSCLNAVNQLRENQKTGYLINEQALLDAVIAHPENYPYTMVSVRYYYLTETNVRDLHLRGYKVVAWTVDDATEIARLKRIGVDAITTNYPDRV